MTQVAIHTLKQKFLHHFAWLLGVFIISFSANAAHHGMKKDIVDIAAGNPDFSTLVTAVKAAGLVDTLKGEVHSPCLLQPTKHSLNCRRAH
ncbi:sensory subunit of low CO2-induced protein complex [Vibrio ishigakensis]|uniref:Sensory subunit of low CO2-induced protein complex n=1 Tax=Vibrio ishigakensis TaxID=1481914 RepID=A0A0B8Q1W3_9VIBR|nr:sensory subunit of low CO2-induced protein complex [Vibrio ishigakensis]